MTDISLSGQQLQGIVQRIESLEADKKAAAEDIKEVYAEAKGNGFDVKTIRLVIKRRKIDNEAFAEQQALFDLYLNALGMLKDTPLGKAAVAREFGAPHLGQAAQRAAKDLTKIMGKPVPPTEEEKARGVKAAFVDKDGMRSSIAVPGSAA